MLLQVPVKSATQGFHLHQREVHHWQHSQLLLLRGQPRLVSSRLGSGWSLQPLHLRRTAFMADVAADTPLPTPIACSAKHIITGIMQL